MAGFLYYELLHHGLHHGRLPVRVFRILRSHHRIHHQFLDRNFGVTMTVWDWVFGDPLLVAEGIGGPRLDGAAPWGLVGRLAVVTEPQTRRSESTSTPSRRRQVSHLL